MKKRKDGRWVKSVTISGRRVYFYSSAKTERQAEKDFTTQLLAYEDKEREAYSFKKIADNWDTEYRNKISDINYRKNTRAAYNRILNYFNDVSDINEITSVEVNIFINSLISKGYYKKTIAAHKCILNMIFQYAILNGYTKYNPVSNIRLPNNLPKSQRELPSTADIKIVDSHYTGFDLLPYFLLYTGLRMSEALAITSDDIDFKNKTITVNKHLLHDGTKPVIEPKTKTQNSQRTVLLLDRLAEKLPRKKGLIFCNDDGSPFAKHQLASKWDRYKDTYNINVTAHQLRHAYATMLFEAGVDLKDAQELMGHSDINLTRQIYTHIRNERKEETAKKLNGFNF